MVRDKVCKEEVVGLAGSSLKGEGKRDPPLFVRQLNHHLGCSGMQYGVSYVFGGGG